MHFGQTHLMNHLMNPFQDQPMSEHLIKSCNVNDILLLIEQTGNQLLDSIDLHLLTHEQEIIVQVVRVVGVRNVSLQEVTLPRFLSQLNYTALELLSTYLNLPVGRLYFVAQPYRLLVFKY